MNKNTENPDKEVRTRVDLIADTIRTDKRSMDSEKTREFGPLPI